MREPELRVAVVQKPPVYLNLAASLERAEAEIAAAGEAGAAIVAFSECWLPGYPVWIDEAPRAALWGEPGAKALYRLLTENAVTLEGPALDRLSKAARSAGASLVMGAQERCGGSLYNTSFFFTPDGACAWHRKLVPTYSERLVWGRGDGSTLAAVDTPAARLGGLICWEHWMPLARAAMHAKQEAVHVAQWPTVSETHQLASRHYAFEGRCFVMASGCLLRLGDVLAGFDSLGEDRPEARALLESMRESEEAFLQYGGSCVAGPDGRFLAEPVFEREGLVTADLDLARLAEERLTLDTAGHYARPDIFELHVDTRPKTGTVFSGDG